MEQRAASRHPQATGQADSRRRTHRIRGGTRLRFSSARIPREPRPGRIRDRHDHDQRRRSCAAPPDARRRSPLLCVAAFPVDQPPALALVRAGRGQSFTAGTGSSDWLPLYRGGADRASHRHVLARSRRHSRRPRDYSLARAYEAQDRLADGTRGTGGAEGVR